MTSITIAEAEARAFLKESLGAAGDDGKLKGAAIIKMTARLRSQLLDAGLEPGAVRNLALRVAEEFRADLPGSAEAIQRCIERGLNGMGSGEPPPNGHDAEAKTSTGEPEPEANPPPPDDEPELEEEEEPEAPQHPQRHPILLSYARDVAMTHKDRKLSAWHRCVEKAGEAIRKGLIEYTDVSDGLLEIADHHSIFGLFTRQKAEQDAAWRDLPHEAKPGGASRFALIALDDIHVDADPAALVEGLLPVGPAFGLVAGAPKTLKSFLLMDMGLHIAAELQYLGRNSPAPSSTSPRRACAAPSAGWWRCDGTSVLRPKMCRSS
jgi:hypothetical protein